MMIIEPSPIMDLTRVDFVGSPKHITVEGDDFNHIKVFLWIWDGDLKKPYINEDFPTIALEKALVSKADKYISIEIGDIIKSYIDPSVVFGSKTMGASSEGVFYQYEIMLYSGDGTYLRSITPDTRYATLGWNWNYEGEKSFSYNRGSYGFEMSSIPKYYSPYIKYFDAGINVSGSLNTNTMINRISSVYGEDSKVCVSNQYIILYLNKLGLWDTFTPSGKVVVSNVIERENYNRGIRNTKSYIPSDYHTSVDSKISSKQKMVVNTGLLKESMGQLVEEILYSSKVYLVECLDLRDGVSITADNSNVSVDSTIINISSGSSSDEYTKYRQIPVVVKSSEFTRRTRLNDKASISYDIIFEESSDKINNIR